MEGVAAGGHEVTGIVSAAVLRYVRRALGPDGVDALLDRAEEPAGTELEDESAWLSLERLLRLAHVASELTGDTHLGRRIGEETMRWTVAQGLDVEQVRRGAPGPAIRVALEFAGRMTSAVSLAVVDEGPTHSDIELRYADGAPRDPLLCSTVTGYFVQVPGQFGVVAAATEPRCVARGDDGCVVRIRWTEAVERDFVARHDAVGQVEQLHTIASELASAADPSALLQVAVDRVGGIVTAPRFVIAALLDDQVVVRQHGLSEDDALEVLATVDDQLAAGARHLCSAELATPRRTYGRLVALFPALSVVGENDPRLLAAYAGHVAAALEATAALESARRDRDTAEIVLRLARGLASATTGDQVAARLERAAADATGASLVRVFRETAPVPTGQRSIVVPLVARNTELGSLVAEWSDGVPGRGARELLRGMADQAALAFDVADLLERVRHQALHDSLTGLPNRTLLRDRAEQAIGLAGRDGRLVGVLFVDLDRFKQVNDDLGHASGDELIRQVGARLRAVLRTSDTVARLGGDEFVVLLPDLDSPETAIGVAEAVRASLHAPFTVGDRTRFVSCTVGVATAAGGTWEELLERADMAMYRAKAAGRDTVAVDPGAQSGTWQTASTLLPSGSRTNAP